MGYKVLYCNMNRSTFAHEVFWQTGEEIQANILCCSEPNWGTVENGWYTDLTKDVGIQVLQGAPGFVKSGYGTGFVWVELECTVVYCCYISPNATMLQFVTFLNDLELSWMRHSKEAIITGDFNAKSPDWGGDIEDRRGRTLKEWVASNQLLILNDGVHPTFRRGLQESYIDLTIVSPNVRSGNWMVHDRVESMSDHQFISVEIGVTTSGAVANRRLRYRQVKPEMVEPLKLAIKKEVWIETHSRMHIEQVMKGIERACKDCLGVVGPPKGRKANYWWNDQVKAKRDAVTQAKRRSTRANRSTSVTQEEKTCLLESYRVARRDLRSAIKDAKKEGFRSLLEDLNTNPWGEAYKMARRNFGGNVVQLSQGEQERYASRLFPTHDKVTWREPRPSWVRKVFTMDELDEAVGKLKTGKSPGPDGISPEVVKIAVSAVGPEILESLNWCLCNGVYPDCWKTAVLSLVPKPSKPGCEPSYRPVCLLDCLGKVAEHMIVVRLRKETAKPLSPAQFGFQEGLSPVHAVNRVQELGKIARGTTHRTKKLAILVTIDAKNAFNSVPWIRIVAALERKGSPRYIIEMVKSYLSNRSLKVGDTTREVSAGVPQGSVLGPTLWVYFFDEVLELKLPPGVDLVGFADDLGLVVTGRSARELVSRTNEMLARVIGKMEELGLEVAREKTEAVMLSSSNRVKRVTISVGGTDITTAESIKYLGVHISRNGRMGHHIKEAGKKSTSLTGAICGLMPLKEGPRSTARKILATAAQGALLYAAPCWVKELRYGTYRDALITASRPIVLRAACARSRAATQVAEVLAGITPIVLRAQELSSVFYGLGRDEASKKCRDAWVEDWTCGNPDVGQWTKRLIPDLSAWLDRRHGEVGYHLAQVLSGHGIFRYGLHKCCVVESNRCVFCLEVDTAEHAVFNCRRFRAEKHEVEQKTGCELTPDSMVECMLRCEESWLAVEQYARATVDGKERAERWQRYVK